MTNTKNGTSSVLLVEDNADDVLLMQRAWTRAGVKVPLELVTDGDEALYYLQGAGQYADRRTFPFPSLVLTDLHLPGTNGFEILRWIRRESEMRGLVVIVLSTSNRSSDIQRAYQLGASSYLVKPSSWHGLTELVHDLDQYWLKWSSFATPPNKPQVPSTKTAVSNHHVSVLCKT